VFINNCSIGSYAQAVERRDALRREHGHGKWYAMLRASIAVFRALRRLRLHIELPSMSLSLRTPFVMISNNRYTGRVFDSSLRSRLDEGRLWLYTTRAKKKVTLLHLVLQTFLRRIDEADALESHAFTEAVIASEHGLVPVAADGEVIAVSPPLRFRIRPASLNVLAPAPSAAPK
jgi:diacylglycerol kinase family enzyme